YLTFASCVLDRVHLAAGGDGVTMRVHGQEALAAHLQAGRGCLLLGAHLGSFEVLRTLGDRFRIDVKALMYRHNAAAITGVMRRLDPAAEAALIEIGRPDTLLRVREALDRGGVVGILADRIVDADKTVPVRFMGAPVRLPS